MLDLGEFAFPLEYGPGEAEGRGWLCPSLLPAPSQRAMFLIRQEMKLRALGPEASHVELWVPAPRNLGEQRRLASRIRLSFWAADAKPGAKPTSLAHETALVYSEPYHNPFLHVRFEAAPGDVTLHVDSWVCNLRPPAGKLQDVAERFRKLQRSSRKLEEFRTAHGVEFLPHWAEPTDDQPRGAEIVHASGNTPFELVAHACQQTAKLVPYEAGKHMTDPFQVMTAGGGDSESRASVVWYALQEQMPVSQVSGYYRPFVDTEFAGFDSWNAMVLDGYCVADVGEGFSYLGHDHAQYVATSIGADHILPELPNIPRHASLSAGLYTFRGGDIEMRQFAALTATSGLAFNLPDGRYTFPQAETLRGRGADAAELDADLREPPPGIMHLMEEVTAKRIEANARK